MNRRDFVRLMGLATGASLLDSCSPERKSEKIIPYLVPPDDGTIPGVASYVHTSSTYPGAYGSGIAAKVVDYRVGKLEGIEGHPLNGGALSAQGQASLSTLYHPDRIVAPLRLEGDGTFVETTWDAAYARIKESLGGGRRNVYLASRTTGTLSTLVDEFCAALNVERLPEFEVNSYSAIREANRIVFGRRELPSYKFDNADFLLTIGADFFETFVDGTNHGRQFAAAKKDDHFNWYHIEPHASVTGFKAKERFVVTPGSEAYLLAYLLRRVSRETVAGDRHIAGIVDALPSLPDRGFAEKTGLTVEQLNYLADKLLKAHHPLVVSGGVSTTQGNGLDVAVLTALLQYGTGMIGHSVDFNRAYNYDNVGSVQDLQNFGQRLQNNQVGVAFLNDVDPLGSPVGAQFIGDSIDNATLRVGMGSFMTETMQSCDLILPLSDPLESWGDCNPVRGVVNVIQPAIEPLYDTKTAGDMLLELTAVVRGTGGAASYQEYLMGKWSETMTGTQQRRLVDQGFVTTGGSAGITLALDDSSAMNAVRGMSFNDIGGDVLYVTPSARAYDERTQHIALLQEVPDVLTTVTWGAWLSVGRETAAERGWKDRDEIEISSNGWSARVPVRIQPGLARNVVAMQYDGMNPTPVAVNGAGDMGSRFDGVSMSKVGGGVPLPILSGSLYQEGRNAVPKPAHHGEDSHHHHDPNATLYPDNPYPQYRWGMVIDMDLCLGCNACTVACYVENNVPVSGHEDHMNGREMSWLRLEPYYEEEGEGVDIQPMLCQHCTNAPCEAVCPVFATYHTPEGLNAQVYNRCVGTRYCANNCPYKVRRFNWFDYKRITPLNTTRNPEVSVRGRGIMEKCSFCVQRIRKARDLAKDEGRLIKDGEVTPACAQSCSTQAITFGNIKDDNSEVAQLASADRAYHVLDILGTKPAVTYLRSKWKEEGDHH